MNRRRSTACALSVLRAALRDFRKPDEDLGQAHSQPKTAEILGSAEGFDCECARPRSSSDHAWYKPSPARAWLFLSLLSGLVACECGPGICVDDGQCSSGAGCLRGQCQVHDAPLLPASLRADEILVHAPRPHLEPTVDGFTLNVADRLAAEPALAATERADSGSQGQAGAWLLTVSGQLHHIDAQGRPRARGQLPSVGPWLAAPTACGSRVYAVSSVGILVGVDVAHAREADGELGLALNLDLGEGTLYPPVCWRGQLLVTTDVLYAFGPAGDVRWVTVLEGRPRSAPVPWGASELAIATSTGELWRIADGGEVRQRLRLRAVAEGRLAMGPGDALAVADAAGRLSVFEGDGTLRFEAELAGPAAAAPLWLESGGLLAADRKGRVTAFSEAGAELGQWQRGARLTGPRVALGAYGIFSGSDRALYVFDAAAKNLDLGPLDEAVVGLVPWHVAKDSSGATVHGFLMALASGFVISLNLSQQGALHR